jgi:hypothetical protein
MPGNNSGRSRAGQWSLGIGRLVSKGFWVGDYGPGRPAFWRTPKESRKGLGSGTLENKHSKHIPGRRTGGPSGHRLCAASGGGGGGGGIRIQSYYRGTQCACG